LCESTKEYSTYVYVSTKMIFICLNEAVITMWTPRTSRRLWEQQHLFMVSASARSAIWR